MARGFGGGDLGGHRGPRLHPGVLNETLKVWIFDRDVSPDIAAQAALDQLEIPDLEVVLLSVRGDVIAVQIVDGAVPDATADILCVSGRGLYEVLRRETWPPAAAGDAPRVLLTLKAWPSA